ncbi:hypothetical protein COT72_01700 [archaeon CG10_big_fil_rev_8_21_14_0_10_43_11]|nr:MAG: hypothetical protein COT72_01700 [archaeon CG10_big_fil_rev_8_21_14_0_10_43_11]
MTRKHKNELVINVSKKHLGFIGIAFVFFVVGFIAASVMGTTSTPETTGSVINTPTQARSVTLTYIVDSSCSSCFDVSVNKQILEQYTSQSGMSIVEQSIDALSEEARAYIEKYGITKIPTFILDKNASSIASLMQVWPSVGDVASDGTLVFRSPEIFEDNYQTVEQDGSFTLVEYVEPRYNVTLDADDPIKGDPMAPVTIVEFSDFQCPYCATFYKSTLQQIESEYVDTGNVRVVFKDYPLSFHENAQKAAEAAQCAHDQDMFWQMHDTLFENQANLTILELKAYASGLGLDMDAFNACLDNSENAAEVAADMAEGIAQGVGGTPAFFVNGRFLNGAQPFNLFQQIIDEELAAREN